MEMNACFPMFRGEVNQAKLLAQKRPYAKLAFDDRASEIVVSLCCYVIYAATHTQLFPQWKAVPKHRSMVPPPPKIERNAWKFAIRDSLRGPAPTIVEFGTAPYIVTPSE